MKKFLSTLLIIIPFTFGACAPDSRNEVPSEVITTYEPKRPVIVEENGYKIARGATKLQDIQASYDKATRSMSLKGKIEYLRVNGQAPETIEVDLAGILETGGFITLKNYRKDIVQKEGVILGAKATCLSDEGTCSAYFIDIYLYTDGIVYHHQVESKADVTEVEEETEVVEKDDGRPVVVKKDPVPKKPSTPVVLEKDDGRPTTAGLESQDLEDSEGGSDVVEDEDSRYIGTVEEDIKNILNVDPVVQPKKPVVDPDEKDDGRPRKGNPVPKAEKKEDSKKDQPKKEEPKKETPKKETPKKEIPKKETPKKEEPKKETPVKVEPKKEEPKKEQPKKDDAKQDGEPDKDDKIPTPEARPEAEPKTPVKTETKSKSIRQAIGKVNSGSLVNGVNMLNLQRSDSSLGIVVIRPERKRYFVTNELAYILRQIGIVAKKLVPDYHVPVGDMSQERGGNIGSHKSHTNGLDADVGFFFENKKFEGYFASAVAVNKPHGSWMAEEQWKLYKHIVSTNLIDRIFLHKALKSELCKLAIKNGELREGKNEGLAYETLRRLIGDTDHNTHFHVRVKCSSAQLACKPLPGVTGGSGCF